MNSVLKLTFSALNELISENNHLQLKFSAIEWQQLEEMKKILKPFLEATQLTQGEKVCYWPYAIFVVMGVSKIISFF